MGSENYELFSSHLCGSKTDSSCLMLHSRFPNLPLQLIGPLHKIVKDDIEWAKEQISVTNNPFTSINKIMLMAPCDLGEGYKYSNCSDITGQSSSVMFHNFEDDIYFQEALCSYLFKWDENNSYFVVMLLQLDSLNRIVEGIQMMVPDSSV